MKRFTDEWERIAGIRRRLSRTSPDVVIGIGDDAAVLTPSTFGQVLSVDASVEGVHFRRGLLTDHDVGYRATAAALSDLAAMGATPRAILSALILPADLDDAALYELVEGIAEAADACAAPVVGGNLSRGAELSITTTVVGNAPATPLTRTGARAGDALYVTGTLGGAALGLRLAENAATEPATILRRFRRPIPRLAEGQRLAGVATAAIDLSDGLLRDLAQVCEASGVGAEVFVDALPLEPGLRETATTPGLDAHELALTGGEDYELLFTAADGVSPPVPATRIGSITAGRDIVLRDARGRVLPLPETTGHSHFRAR